MKRNLIILTVLTISVCAHAQNADSITSIKESETPFIGTNTSNSYTNKSVILKNTKTIPVYNKEKTSKDLALNILYKLDWQYWSPDDTNAKIALPLSELDNKLEDGIHTFFYKNGKEMAEGEIKNGERNGQWTSWYSNGITESEGNYYNGFKIGTWKCYYSNGKPYSVENYVVDKNYIDILLKDGIAKHVKITNADLPFLLSIFQKKQLYSGISTWFYPNGQKCTEEFWNIVLLSSMEWDKNGVFHKIKDNNRYQDYMRPPTFDDDFYTFLKKHSDLSRAERKGIGKVVVSFVLTSSGKINNIDLGVL